jgi:predicted amidohydrolase
MQDLTIALVQANQLWENKEGNLSHYEQLLKEVSSVDLILLPEMFHTAFSMNAILLAETMENSVGLEWLKTIAREKNAAIYTSLIIKEQDHFYNRGVFIEPNGKLSIYDKRKTFGLAGEDTVFSAGEKETIVSYKGWKIQLQICYDLRFPEIVRNRIENDNQPAYDAILYVANWPQKRNIHWKSLLKARAIENQCYVIGVNRIGRDNNDLNYSGDSVCVDMLGEETTCKAEIEEIKKVNLSKTVLDSTRKMLPFLKDK